jgi:hypothetical protein
METGKIHIKLSPLPYSKRRRSIFNSTILLYTIVLVAAGIYTDLKGFGLTATFLFVLFLLDYSRRLRWVRFLLERLETNSLGVKLTYYDKDNLVSTTIPWNKLSVTKGSTFSKNPTKSITFRNGESVIASFYATDNFDNEEIEVLYQKIERTTSANATLVHGLP